MPVDLLKEKNLIERYLQIEAHELSAVSFVNVFLWKDFFDFDLKIMDNHLCIFAENTIGCFLYLPPLGKGFSARAVEECFNIMAVKNKGSEVSRIENIPEDMQALFDSSRFTFFKKSDEYVYRREDIASLRGNAYKAKRAAYNQFVKNNRFHLLSYNKVMLRECMALYKRWAAFKAKSNNDEVYRQMLEENALVHELALKHDQSLGLVGKVIAIDGEIRAYSFGYALNQDTFCVLFEIADTEIKGLATGIFKEFCDDLVLKKYSFINVMDDFGLKNIRATKLSFRPYRTVSSFVVSRKKSHATS